MLRDQLLFQGGFKRVSKKRPCRICGKPTYCGFSTDEGTSICMRVSAGLEYRLWKTTLDFSVPSFFGMLFDHRGARTRMVVGGAAHPDAERAVQKTLCELVQGLSWLEYMGERNTSGDFDEIHTFTDRAILYANRALPDAYSFLFDNGDPIPLSSIPSRHAPTNELLQQCIVEMLIKGFHPSARSHYRRCAGMWLRGNQGNRAWP